MRGGSVAALLAASWMGGCDRDRRPPAPPPAAALKGSQPHPIAVLQVPVELRPEAEAPVRGEPAVTVTEPAAEPIAPGGVPAAGLVPAFTPLADAAVGERARLKAMGGRELLYEVLEVRAATVTLRVTVFDHGKPLGSPAQREDFKTTDPVAVAVAAVKARRAAEAVAVELAGRTWDATLYEDRWMDEGVSYVRRTWVSPEAPVFGILRMELYGDDQLEASLELMTGGRQERETERRGVESRDRAPLVLPGEEDGDGTRREARSRRHSAQPR